MTTAFKLSFTVWFLGFLPNLFQVSGCLSAVAAFFTLGLFPGLMALAVFLVFLGHVVNMHNKANTLKAAYLAAAAGGN